MSDVTIDAEPIPEELKQRDQWLMWDASADAPRRPHWHGDFGVSWTDPDDWHSFEEALEAAEEKASWGIGYVFARSNEDYPRGLYGALDLDGCVGDDGPKDWLPSLQEFFDEDAYLEFSPSGEGIHIPLVGFEPPSWWSNVHMSEEEHEGVEAYGKKFFTFTGDALKGSGDEVADADDFVEEWLIEAYTTVTGETPPPLQDDGDADDREPSRSREELEDIETTSDMDDVLDAIDHLRPADLSLSSSKTADENGDWESWDPGYRSSSSGKSLKRYKASGLFLDFAEASPSKCSWFGPLDLYAAENGIISRPWDELSGDDWRQAVEDARDAGAPIPVYEAGPPPKKVSESDDSDVETPDREDPDGEMPSRSVISWDYVRFMYEDEDKKDGRYYAAQALEDRTSWMYVVESETLWVYDEAKGYFNRWGEQHAARVLEDRLDSHYSRSEKEEIVARLEARNQTHRDELNAGAQDGYHVCVGNGVVDLETGDLHDHDPSFKFTRGLRWEYEPAGADPTPVLEFLDDITEREEDRDTLLDHLAHGLMPGHPFRAFVITYGPGSNGKTQMGQLFRGFVGEDNAASVELQDLTGDDQFATGGLPGAFVNVGDDISVSEIRDVSILKSLTGSGTIRANEKYEKQYEFQNEAAMFFSANEPPRIAEESDAIGDRLYPIEMPYRFVGEAEYDPEDPTLKRKETGIASRLLENEAAMRGLLLLCVKHAQDLIESSGEYSLPEGPRERREMYEAASDPIRRFGLKYLEQGDKNDLVLKDDAYDVYNSMCEQENERVASEDGFKRQISQQALLDLESTRTRNVTPGDSRDMCWRYVRFTEEAKDLMPSRLVARYFDQEGIEDDDDGDGDAGVSGSERAAFGAVSIPEAAESLTGYVTVTAEIATTKRLGEQEAGLKAILSDSLGTMDLVVWDEALADRLEDLEEETVAVRDAEVTEYEGKRQLSSVEGLTEVTSIQAGVGFSEGATPDDSQGQLEEQPSNTSQPASDGGQRETESDETKDEESPDASGIPEDAEGLLADAQRLRDLLEDRPTPMEKGDIVVAASMDQDLMPPDRVKKALEYAVERKGIVIQTEEGYVPN